MKLSNLDPVSLNHVLTLENAPYVVEGNGEDTFVIYFESDRNRQQFLQKPFVGVNETITSLYG